MILKFETGKGGNRDIFHGLLFYSIGILPSANSTRILKNRVRKRTANRFVRTNSRFSSRGDEFCEYLNKLVTATKMDTQTRWYALS